MLKILFYILVMLLPAFLITALYTLFHTDKSKLKKVLINCIRIFLIINLISISMLHYFYGLTNLFNPVRISYQVLLYFLLNSLLVGLLYIALDRLFYRLLNVIKRENKPSISSKLLYVLAILLFFIGALASTSSAWASVVYYGVSPDQIFITMFTPITGTDSKLIMSYIEGPLILALTLAYIFAMISYSLIFTSLSFKREAKALIGAIGGRRIATLGGLLVLIVGLCYGIFSLDLDKIVVGYTIEDSFIADNYVDPTKAKITVPNKKRNLIHIYLESIENSFLDEAHGGIMEENLMPNLLKLYNAGDNFSNLNNGEGYGGPLRTYGGSFSCASMVNQQFGLPMRIPTEAAMYSKEGHFLPGAFGLSDLLAYLGYNQTILMGCDSIFSGLTYLYQEHGYFKIIDYKYAKENGLIPSDYHVNWGYEDEKLYSFAKNEILRLAALPEPFNVIVKNADTHNPGFAFDGDKPIFGDSDIKEDYAKTISFSERHVYDFVNWAMEQEFFADTTIVIIGDHNSMDSSLFKGMESKDYIRTTYNLIINPVAGIASSQEVFYNREWSNFDMLPTILSALGFKIEGDRLGLGTNLYSGKKTLFEELGYDYVNKKLVYKSSFYHKQFVKRKNNYNGDNLIYS